jgi:uncharacterized protein YbjT (DUF2867 family)
MTISDPDGITLVVGATGRHGGTGGHVLRRLRQEGRPVRALVRVRDKRAAQLEALGADVVVGDLEDRASLLAALDDVAGVYFTYPVGPGVVTAAATLASAIRGSRSEPRVAALSYGTAGPGSPSPLHRAHAIAEEVLAWAGLDLTVLRIAAVFHENLLPLLGQAIRSTSAIRNNFGDAAVTWISASDAGELAATALLHPGRYSTQSTHVIAGTEQLTNHHLAAILSEETGRRITYTQISQEQWLDELIAQGVPADSARHITTMGAAIARTGPSASPADSGAIPRLTGRPAIDFRAFVRTHITAFAPVSAT